MALAAYTASMVLLYALVALAAPDAAGVLVPFVVLAIVAPCAVHRARQRRRRQQWPR